MDIENDSYAALQGQVKIWAARASDDMPPDPFRSKEIQKQALENEFIAEIDEVIKHLSNGFKVLYDRGCMADWSQDKINAFKENFKLLTSEKTDEVDSIFQEKLGFADEDMMKWYECGQDLHKNKLYREAGEVFLVLTTLNPRVPSFWIGLAEAQEGVQQPREAAESYLMAVTNEDLTPALYSAQCYEDLGEIDKATEVLDKALALVDQLEGQDVFKQKAIALKNNLGK